LWRRNQRLTAGAAPAGRRYPQFISAFARVRRPLLARRLLDESRLALSERERESYFARNQLRDLEGDVLMAEERPSDAAAAYQAIRRDASDCSLCVLAKLGYAYDQAGSLDSALVYYQRYVETPGARVSPGPSLIAPDELWLAPTLRRLGELYEQRGDRVRALDYYGRFVELWKDADPELQPLVRDVRGRMARLGGEQPR
jgi:tetratricopeptide (TPR) repeat protein